MKSRFYKLRRKKERPYLEISLMPLIDVALNLLIIFMVATPMLQQENGIQVELPKGNVKETDDSIDQQIVVFINKKGLFFVDSVQVTAEKLIETIKKMAGAKGDRTVFVKADTAVSYGKVIELVDQIKHVGGVRYVALATSKVD